MMSRKKELLTLMMIDTSWYKNSESIKDSDLEYYDLELEASSCEQCILSKSRNKVVFGKGDRKSKIFIIGEAPGKDEDLNGEPFIGRAGKLLTEILLSIQLERSDVYITNTIKCRPPENRNPNSDEIESCSHFLDKEINLISPEVIILLGKVAAETVLHSSKSMAELRGKIHYYKNTKIPTLVFYHPAYLLRSPYEKRKVWDDILFMKREVNVS